MAMDSVTSFQYQQNAAFPAEAELVMFNPQYDRVHSNPSAGLPESLDIATSFPIQETCGKLLEMVRNY
jgi:hypothetical protein